MSLPLTLKNMLWVLILVALSVTFGAVAWNVLRPPLPVEIPAPEPPPKMCLTFDLLGYGEGGWMRVAEQELCGYSLEWGKMLGPSFDDTLATVENERDAWRDCALDPTLCAGWQKEWGNAP